MREETVLHGDLGGRAARLPGQETLCLQQHDAKAALFEQVSGQYAAYAAADDAHVAGDIAFKRSARAGRWGVCGQEGLVCLHGESSVLRDAFSMRSAGAEYGGAAGKGANPPFHLCKKVL